MKVHYQAQLAAVHLQLLNQSVITAVITITTRVAKSRRDGGALLPNSKFGG